MWQERNGISKSHQQKQGRFNYWFIVNGKLLNVVDWNSYCLETNKSHDNDKANVLYGKIKHLNRLRFTVTVKEFTSVLQLT